MASDLSKLLENLSGDDIANLQQMAQSIFGEGQSFSPSPSPPPEQARQEARGEEGGLGIDPKMMLRLGKLMSSAGGSDQRSALLLALKPHLSPERQARTDNAIQILKLLKILPALGDFKL